MLNQKTLQILIFFCASLFEGACSTAPAIDPSSLTVKEAKAWLNQYCSKSSKSSLLSEFFGGLVMKANTKELKGQFPASVHGDQNGSFQLEVNNILGGTVAQILSDQKSLEVKITGKPQFDRKGVTQYLGIELPVLRQLLRGDLPCPTDLLDVSSAGGAVVVKSSGWSWQYERALSKDQNVPARLSVLPIVKVGEVPKDPAFVLAIEDWDVSQGYIRKARLVSAEGSLSWTWRSRELK